MTKSRSARRHDASSLPYEKTDESGIIEAYIQLLQSGDTPSPSAFGRQFPSVTSQITRKLRNIAEVHAHCNLLSSQHPEGAYPSPGETILGFHLIEEIGRGSFSRVFLAADLDVASRRVVVKLTMEPNTEIECLGSLCHPHLPKILSSDFDASSGLTVICLEFIGTRSLRDLLLEQYDSPEPIPGKQHDRLRFFKLAENLIAQIASGLAHAHENGVLHLDVKPENILIRESGEAVLIDFNLSSHMAASSTLGFRGTVQYAAPELIESLCGMGMSREPPSRRSDIYSLAVVATEVFTGSLPWREPPDNTPDTVLQTRQSLHIDMPEAPGGVGRQIQSVLAKALETSPAKRYHTVDEFLHSLQQAATDVSPHYFGAIGGRLSLVLCVFLALAGVLLVDAGAITSKSSPHPTALHNQIHRSSQVPRTQDSAGPLSHEENVPANRRASDEITLGWDAIARQEFQFALQCFENRDGSPVDVRLLASRGYVQLCLQQYDAAYESLRDAMRLGNLENDVPLRVCTAVCCYTTQRWRALRKCLAELRTISVSSNHAFVISWIRSHAASDLQMLDGDSHESHFVSPDVAYQDTSLDELISRLRDDVAFCVQGRIAD